MDDLDHILNAPWFASIALPFLSAAPVWMDLEDLMQDARVAVLQHRRATYGVIDGLRRDKRKARSHGVRNSKTIPRERGWEVSLEEREEIQQTAAPEAPERSLFLAKYLHQLTTKQQHFVALMLEDLAPSQIAALLHITRVAGSMMHKRILVQLRQRMLPH